MTNAARVRLQTVQEELFAGLVRGEVSPHTTGMDPELLSAIVKKHHAENVASKLETFFPTFYRWARPDQDFLVRHFQRNKTTGPARAVIEHAFRAAFAAAAELEHAAIWRELLVLERAERIAEKTRKPATADYITALRTMTERTFEASSIDEAPFVFVRTRTNLIDIYHAYDPRGAVDLGFTRTAAYWCPPGASRAEPRTYSTLRELAIELAFV